MRLFAHADPDNNQLVLTVHISAIDLQRHSNQELVTKVAELVGTRLTDNALAEVAAMPRCPSCGTVMLEGVAHIVLKEDCETVEAARKQGLAPWN